MRPTFRPDLVCSREEQQGVVFYRVDDPKSETNFRLYEIEYLIATKLDGTRTLDEVIQAVRADYSFDISDADLNRFVAQLDAMGFLLPQSAKASDATEPMADTMEMAADETVTTIDTAEELPIDIIEDHSVDTVEMERLLRSALLHVKQGYIVHARDYFLAARELDPTDEKLAKLVSHLEIIGDSSGPAEVEYLWDQARKLFPAIVSELGTVIDAKSGGPQTASADDERRHTINLPQEDALRHRLVWLAVLLVVVCGGGGGLYWFARKNGMFGSGTEARVVVLEAAKIPLFYAQTAGSVRPLKEKEATFTSAGTVEAVNVKQGDHVQQGDPLATLALPAAQQKQIDTVKTFITKQQAQYDKVAERLAAIDQERKTTEEQRDAAAEKLRELQPKLLLNQGVTARDINQQKMARNMAVKKLAMIANKAKGPQKTAGVMKGKLDTAKNRLRGLEKGLANHVVKAPFAGTVISPITVKVGDEIAAGTVLLAVRDESEAILAFDIPGKVTVKAGDEVQISVDGGAPSKGKVSAVEDKDAATHVEVSMPDPSGMYPVMQPDKFRMMREEVEQAFRVPSSALAKNAADNTMHVYVLQQSRAAARPIEIVSQDAAQAIVRDPSGALKDGDKLVTASTETGDVSGIADGTFLKPVE